MGTISVLFALHRPPDICAMYQTYVNYFRWLCAQHERLLHSDERKVFEVISVEEALGDFRSRIGLEDFYFFLIDYTWSVNELGGFQYQEKQGGFVIAKKLDVRNVVSADRVAARDQLEIVVNDFISHILADAQNGHPLFSNNDTLSSLKVNVQPLFLTGDGSYDALICTFEFNVPLEYRLECHPSLVWRELSPHNY